MDNSNRKYSVTLSFEEVKLPPFEDILILAKNSLQGKIALSESFELLMPGSFEVTDIDDERAEAIFISKKLLTKIPKEQIISILKDRVFQFVADGEILKVDFRLSASMIL